MKVGSEGEPLQAPSQSSENGSPTTPKVPTSRAFWSLLDDIWGIFDGSWAVLGTAIAQPTADPDS